MRPFYFLFLYLLTATSIAQQNNLEKQLARLSKELQGYERQYEELAVRRGLDYKQGDFTAEKLREAIHSYAHKAFAYEQESSFSFLFYYFFSDTLNIWLFNAEGKLQALKSLSITPDSLSILETALKRSLRRESSTIANRKATVEFTEERTALNRETVLNLLSRILLPNEIISEMVNTRYLVILPCLNISSIPFGMLKPWNNGNDLIDMMAYSFVHNMRDFFYGSDPSGLTNKGVEFKPLVVGNPLFKDSCTIGLPSLVGAEEEAKEVSRQLGTEALIGIEAQKEKVIERMKHSSFIYLATHGYSDPENALHASYLALYDSAGCGFLTPYEIQHFKLTHAQVILSACETGNGKVLDAGIIGLARGFMKAGARTVTMSLWAIDDAQTKNLMLLYLDELKKEAAFYPAENLRRAILRYKANYNTEPFYWASFQTFGTPLHFTFQGSIHKRSFNE